MTRPHSASFTAALALGLGLLCGFNVRAVESTAAPSTEKPEAPAPQTTLPPKVEAKLKEFLGKLNETAVKSWDTEVAKKIDEIASATGLGDDGKKALQPPAKVAVQNWADKWTSKMADIMRKQLAGMASDQAVKLLEQRMTQNAGFAPGAYAPDVVMPFDQDSWNKALQQTLTPDQMAAWDKTEKDRKDTIEKQIADGLKSGTDRIRTQQNAQIAIACKEIESAVKLPKDRSDKLESLGKSVVDQTTATWRKRVEQSLFSMGDAQRTQFSQGRFFMGVDDNESPTQQQSWQDGVAAILTSDEKKQLDAEKDQRKAKRVQVMADVFVMELDEKLALTEEQRQKLKPIAARIVPDVAQLFPGDGGDFYYGYSADVFISAWAKAADADLKPILDKVQLQRWKDLSKPDDGATNQQAEDKSAKGASSPEPEDVDKAISLFLYNRMKSEQKRALETNLLKAEDITRVAGLSGDSEQRLRTAALGVADTYLANWKWFIEQQIRSQLQDVTPQNVKQRLENIQEFFFQRNFGLNGRTDIWDKTVKVALTQKEQDAWKKETDARAAFHDKAIAGFVMAEFDRQNRLTPEQWDKLEPKVADVLRDYGQGISQMFAFGNGAAWYMEGPYLLMPMAGISDDDFKAILTKEQIDSWHGSQQCATATSLWANVAQMHAQRNR